MIGTTAIPHIEHECVKRAASGRWRDILTDVGHLNRDDLDCRHHPCPKCGGTDRFRAFDDVDETGGVLCNQCFNEKNGDGVAALQWLAGWTFPESLYAVAEYLGIVGVERKSVDIVADVARAKRMPVESFRAFGAMLDHRGKLEVARVPMFDQYQKRCSSFDMALISPEFEKGLSAKGQPVGLFVATWPKEGDTVFLVEGVKDAAALRGLGYFAIGLPGSKMAAKFARVFAGCHVIIVPDRDTTGEGAAQITAGRLAGVAVSVRIATLPGELMAKDGDGVREVLAMKDGDSLLRQAIADAKSWQPTTDDETTPADVGDERTNIATDQGRTELANARRIVAEFGDDIRFCHVWSKWFCWDGTRWKLDDDGAVQRMATTVADAVWNEVSKNHTKDTIDFAEKTSRASGINAMLKLAASMLPIRVDELDANHWLLNCPNGTVDLQTGELRPHRREDKITKLCPTNYSPEASTYHWDKFLESVFGGLALLIDFLQSLFGYCLTGDVREQHLTVFHGLGANGKSTLLTAIQDALGIDYSSAAPPCLLMEKKSATHPTELAGLFGKRLVVAQESNQGAKLAESTVKQLTGGDRVSARRMREDFWEFPPTHKLILCTNHKPRIKGNDHAIWRRLLLIPFTNKFWNPAKGETGPDELKQDKALPAKLKAEAEGILAWMVQGCLAWQRDGLQVPDIVRAATEGYRSESDTIGRFVAECCLTEPATRVRFGSLYSALESWCGDAGDTLPSRKFTGEWLRSNGYEDKHSGVRWYLGIALKEGATA